MNNCSDTGGSMAEKDKCGISDVSECAFYVLKGDSLVLSVNSVTMGAAPVLTVTDCCNACLNNPKVR